VNTDSPITNSRRRPYTSASRPPSSTMAYELREIADVVETCPELADLDNPVDAAQRMLMDLDSL
jgi:hypothetical protein